VDGNFCPPPGPDCVVRLIEFPKVFFDICREVTGIETFATGRSIRELQRLRKFYGRGRWRKRKGFATVRLPNGTIREAEIHWHEASGIGKKELKIKRLLD
jgi:hypothetical protein